MSQQALRLQSADLEQCAEPAAAVSARIGAVHDQTAREAQALAALAGEFGLFGLNLVLDWKDAWEGSADEPYRLEQAPSEAANDAAPSPRAPFPALPAGRWHVEARYASRLIPATDWIVIALTAQLAALWGSGLGLLDLSIGQAGAFVMGALSLKLGLWLTESYRTTPARMRPERGVGGLALGAILGILVANAFAPDARSAAALAATLPFAAMLLAGIHAALAIWISAAHRKGVFAETVVLVGATASAERLAARLTRGGEARVVAIVDDRLARAPAQLHSIPVAGNLDDLLAWQDLPHVDRIVIAVTQKAEARVRSIIERMRPLPNRVDLLLDYDTTSISGRGFDKLSGAALACVSGRPHSAHRALLKRMQDIALSATLIALFALPMLLIAAAVKFDSRGPVLYRQRRHGFNNRIITVLKFRTMRHEPDAPLRQVTANDPRITRIGRFLRRTSLDELPQLLNVLKGEMSLVGPRPHAVGMKAAERNLHDIVAEYAHRHRVKPGITGWAQINGSRGPLETPAAVRERLKLDLDYVARASLWFDVQILLRTAPALFGDKKVTR